MSGENNFKSNEFVLRAQKKVLSQFSNRKAAKVFINESLSSLLDLLYQLIKTHTKDKKIAEKFVKNIIKISIKVGLLAQSGQFSKDEMGMADKFVEKFRGIAFTITSFTEVEYSYDQKFLISSISKAEDQLINLIKPHLTEKSINRVKNVCSQLKDSKLLDASFSKGTSEHEVLLLIVIEINKAIENGDL